MTTIPFKFDFPSPLCVMSAVQVTYFPSPFIVIFQFLTLMVDLCFTSNKKAEMFPGPISCDLFSHQYSHLFTSLPSYSAHLADPPSESGPPRLPQRWFSTDCWDLRSPRYWFLKPHFESWRCLSQTNTLVIRSIRGHQGTDWTWEGKATVPEGTREGQTCRHKTRPQRCCGVTLDCE